MPLRVLGVLSRKGADIIGEDQDDLVVAPWTTVKFRISSGDSGGESVATRPNPADLLAPEARKFPAAAPRDLPDALTDSDRLHAPAVPPLECRLDPRPLGVTDEIPAAMEEITRVLRQRHRIGPDAAADFAGARLHRGRACRQGTVASSPACSCASP